WMEAFPTLAALAGADRGDVLRVWGRAGYPRRAANLQEAAVRCMADHEGQLPRDREDLLAPPGVGPFTAAIVQTFGFGDDAAAVDTNIVRVIGRVAFGDLQPAKETPPRAIVDMAEQLLPSGEATRWNPALMDYGASVCTPRPRCHECVISSLCVARPRFEAGETAEPVRAQGTWDGSDRMWRGRIMQVLRDTHMGDRHTRDTHADDATSTTVAAVMRRVQPGDERARVRRLLDDLAREGLAWVDGRRCGLGHRPPLPQGPSPDATR
ncbi:MAG: hypothetical protein O2888_02825, partial [Chloroflexi bacterium]|nr:hypothetical protein [Chloroflexota bacterium]